MGIRFAVSLSVSLAVAATMAFTSNANARSKSDASPDRPSEVVPVTTTPVVKRGDAKAEEIKIARRRRRRRTPPKVAPVAPAEPAAAETAPIRTNSRRPSRVEFDERLIRGQTNKADAIYLFERRASELRTLVKKRKHFHREIDETLD